MKTKYLLVQYAPFLLFENLTHSNLSKCSFVDVPSLKSSEVVENSSPVNSQQNNKLTRALVAFDYLVYIHKLKNGGIGFTPQRQ